MPKVFKSQLIEVILPGIAGGNNATKIQFQDQPYLRNKKITGIEIFTKNDINASPTNKEPITGEQMGKSYLTLYLNDVQSINDVGEWIQNVPFVAMHRVQNNIISPTALPVAPGVQYTEPFVRSMFELQEQVIYWEKCYITLATAFANTTDVSFLLNVYFK